MNHDHYHNVMMDEDLEALLRYLHEKGDDTHVMSLDIETTGLDPWEKGASIVSISLTECHPDEPTWVIPLDHPQGPWGRVWKSTLMEVVISLRNWKIAAHNANFDLGWIRRFVPHHPLYMWWDTMTVAHLLDENQSKKLKNLAAPLMEGDWAIDVRNTKAQPWFLLASYNAFDTIATARLYAEQQQSLTGQVKRLALTNVLPAQRALIEITHRGLPLDVPAAREALVDNEERAEKAADRLMDRAILDYGMDSEDSKAYPTISWEPTAKWFLAFTEQAMEAGDLYAQEMTPGGRPSWRGGVLEQLVREGNEIAEEMLEYRDAAKKAQFLRSWLDKADDEGRVHGNFNIARTSTGRLSSSDPNLQQVARDLKHLWRADLFAEVDFSQIELRVAAEMIHRTVLPDNPMLKAFREGQDLHSMAATLVTGGDVAGVTSEERQKGKAVNFGFIFGMGASKFTQYALETYGVEFTLDEAYAVREGFFDLWKGLGDWHEHQIEQAHTQGYVENLYGRRRRLPDIYSTDEWTRSAAERQAINSPVQATASDMMLEALSRIESSLPHDLVRLIGTVHDSALLEIREVGDIEDVCTIMVNPTVSMEVPIEVEASIGQTWGNYDTTIIRSNA